MRFFSFSIKPDLKALDRKDRREKKKKDPEIRG